MGPCAQREADYFGRGVDVSLLIWDLPLRRRQRNVFSSCEKKFDKISVRPIYRWKRLLVGFLKMWLVSRSHLGFTRNLLKCNSNFDSFPLHWANCSSKLRYFSLAINVQTEIIGKKYSACTLMLGIWHIDFLEAGTITACQEKVKFKFLSWHGQNCRQFSFFHWSNWKFGVNSSS